MDIINETPRTYLVTIDKMKLSAIIQNLDSLLGLVGRRSPDEARTFGTGKEGIAQQIDFVRDSLEANVEALKDSIC